VASYLPYKTTLISVKNDIQMTPQPPNYIATILLTSSTCFEPAHSSAHSFVYAFHSGPPRPLQKRGFGRWSNHKNSLLLCLTSSAHSRTQPRLCNYLEILRSWALKDKHRFYLPPLLDSNHQPPFVIKKDRPDQSSDDWGQSCAISSL